MESTLRRHRTNGRSRRIAGRSSAAPARRRLSALPKRPAFVPEVRRRRAGGGLRHRRRAPATRRADRHQSGREAPAASPQTSNGFSLNWLRGLRPAPLVAVAAVAVVAATLLWQQSRESEGILLRDESVTQSALPPAEVLADGSIRLTWAAVPGADAYQIRIYGPSFTEIYRHPNVAETSALVERSSLPADLPPTLDLMWRVYALHAGDIIQTSDPGSIRTR